jgi:menaquinone-dependent protoporphyrinogen oxidase
MTVTMNDLSVLVAVSSKYGATAEIAEAIASELGNEGLSAAVVTIDGRTSLAGYGAAIVGSAVYMGRWLTPAREFVETNAAALGAMPVWLFSSGPVGDPPKPEEDPVDVQPLMEATSALEHRVFAGRLERSRLSFAEKAVVIALRAPQGDFRDWTVIREWAREIAGALQAESRHSGTAR